jgi:ketosteroid isomerase-like protein
LTNHKLTTNTPVDNTPDLAADIVNEFLRLIMLPDPVAARRYTASNMKILFTGGRAMREPADCTKFNAARYKWVKKRIERTETVLQNEESLKLGDTVVYSLGTLYGEWPDGTPFEGNRYVDRYVVRDGLITHMDVWNDSAEWMLVRADLATL